MSGFTSPYEEDNPFADMHGNGLSSSKSSSPPPPMTENVDETADGATVPQGSLDAKESEMSSDAIPTSTRSSNDLEPTAQKAPWSGRRHGTGRKPIRASAISSRLETLALDSDPLGPLGQTDDGESSPAPPPPQKSMGNTQARPRMETYEEAQSTLPQEQRQPRATDATRAPSIPLEQAANPTFSISVGDPTKIGDLTSAHTVYKVSTKTSSKAFKTSEFSVTRRYRDFLWLYDQLNRNAPGAIVPPPPEKQAVGRFSENFIEARRYALERMLDKIAKHPILRTDGDFKLFLESETFSVDIKQRPVDQKIAHESHKGFLGLGSAFTMSGKFIESDEYFDQQKATFDSLDHQLKQLSKAVDIVIKQRKDLAQSTSDFGAALSALSTVELSRTLSDALGSLSDLQDKIKELHERQAQQDLLTLGHTVEEYVRLISSIKQAFSARQKAWLAWQSAEGEAAKRKSTGDKIRKQARTQQDRLSMVDQEMTDAERKSHQLKSDFENVGKLLRAEIKRFDADKVEDFKTSVEVFLESAVEAQKELIEHWEFYSELLASSDEDSYAQQSDTLSKGKQSTIDSQAITDSNAPVSEQEEILQDSSIEPRPTTSGTTDSGVTATSIPSTTSSRAPIPHSEANPFANESV